VNLDFTGHLKFTTLIVDAYRPVNIIVTDT